MSKSLMFAQCTDRNGQPHAAQIDVNACPRWSVENLNGQLVCSITFPAR